MAKFKQTKVPFLAKNYLNKFLKESESPFNVEQPLSQGGPSEDPNTRHISSTNPFTAEDTPPSAYANDYYLSVLNWWLTAYPDLANTQAGQGLIILWSIVANYWYYQGPIPGLTTDTGPAGPGTLVRLRDALLYYAQNVLNLPLPKDFYDNKFAQEQWLYKVGDSGPIRG